VRTKQQRLLSVVENGFHLVNSAFNGICKEYFIKNLNPQQLNYKSFLKDIKSQLLELINGCSGEIKYNLKLEATYHNPKIPDSDENRAFKTSAREIFTVNDIQEEIEHDYSKLLEEEEIYMAKGSGYTLKSIDGLLVAIYRYIPLRGSSHMQLPFDIKNKKCVINVQNSDDMCFKYSILSKHVSRHIAHRIGKHYHDVEHLYDFTHLNYPVNIKDITKQFEKFNPTVSVNVYGLKNGTRCIQNKQAAKNPKKSIIFPLKVCNIEKEHHFDLLLLSSNSDNHYCLISNFSRLVNSQMSSDNHASEYCKRCFTKFNNTLLKTANESLVYHKQFCGDHKSILPVMPIQNTKIKFNNWERTQFHPFIIIADFESILQKTDANMGPNTRLIHTHNSMSYCLYVISNQVPEELLSKFKIPKTPILYRGNKNTSYDSIALRFVKDLTEIARRIDLVLCTNINIIMTPEERLRHSEATKCELCQGPFILNNTKVADHCHLSGKFRQTLCSSCNFKLKRPDFVSCVLHNLTNYDAHFIVRQLGFDNKHISVIPNSEEKYISFTKSINNRFSIRFIDSFRFMSSSLSNLTNNLAAAGLDKFKETSKIFSQNDLFLTTRKGCFPYEYTSDWEKLNVTSLPPKQCFYSSLNDEHISDEDYEHALKVWDHFKCKNLGEYSDLYLKIDTLILADVFQNFRNLCFQMYGLDPAYYYTAPGFSFDCMLKHTKVEIELISDYTMLLMVEKGIRGGLTQASKRYSKANHPYTKNYESNQKHNYIIYIDACNLYGWSMSKKMPLNNFKWYDGDEKSVLSLLEELDENSNMGLIFDVDISYSANLHDLHNDLPYLPERVKPVGSNVSKLLATLQNKKHYVVHYMALKQAMLAGLKVDKVHRVVQFNQSAWLAPYIKKNTIMRKIAKNKFEENFYKHMNNSVSLNKLLYNLLITVLMLFVFFIDIW